MLLLLVLIVLAKSLAEELILERNVACKSETMDVSLLFARPFVGSIFTEKGFEKKDCRWKGSGQREIVVNIPLAEATQCGISINENMGEVSVKLIISPMDGIIVDGYAALAIKCTYSTQEITLTLPAGQPLHISGINVDSSVVTGNGGAPVLSLHILEGHGTAGNPLTRASVGQRITLDAVLKDTSIYDFFLHSCQAHDGSNSEDAKINIIDENGCGVRMSRAIDVPVMLSEPVQGGPKHVYLHMYGFQFTSSQFVHFECQARPCVHQCKQQQCSSGSIPFPKGKKFLRSRRQNEITEEDHRLDTLKLLTVLQIEPQHVQQAALVSSSFSKEMTCLSHEALLLSAIALFITLAASACFCFYAMRKAMKQTPCDDECNSEQAYSIASLYR